MSPARRIQQRDREGILAPVEPRLRLAIAVEERPSQRGETRAAAARQLEERRAKYALRGVEQPPGRAVGDATGLGGIGERAARGDPAQHRHDARIERLDGCVGVTFHDPADRRDEALAIGTILHICAPLYLS